MRDSSPVTGRTGKIRRITWAHVPSVGPASRRFPGVHLSLFRGELSGELSDAEQAALVLRDGPRRDEWIRGRLAMRQALGPEARSADRRFRHRDP